MEQVPPKQKSDARDYCCYLIVSHDEKASYCGTTNNFTRRLRQHNCEIAGGARYTTRCHQGGWKPLFVIWGFANRSQALSFEWHVKRCPVHPGTAPSRRRQQVVCTLHNTRWWEKFPPCPTDMYLEHYPTMLYYEVPQLHEPVTFQFHAIQTGNKNSIPNEGLNSESHIDSEMLIQQVTQQPSNDTVQTTRATVPITGRAFIDDLVFSKPESL